ncbi:Methylthioribose-1-phosphate isomerase [Podospora australis]|uniref:Methylthioribose-1-phosphate isomerase n=1 Tax=Podospora australis TaxID=1536484 RepID=A0AAN7AIE0_9PEZI|nr:Methylthioribose-1-phosphate isomerase [Podospora australis]
MATSHGTSEWKKRSVVSNFIFKFDGTQDGKPKVALFKRSDKVSTYQHHIAPISGSIDPTDPSPLAAAWREIREETTLTPSSITLLRRGKPYTFTDPSVKREWTIHPFMFRLKPETPDSNPSIKIDWEHESWAWYSPDTIIIIHDSYKGVPRLAESLRRVYFETDLGHEPGRILSSGLQALSHDHESGARQLASKALQTLRDVVAALGPPLDSRQQWWSQVRTAGWHLCANGRPSMNAAITSALLTALSEIESQLQLNSTEEDATKTALQILDTSLTNRSKTAEAISSAFAAYMEQTFPAKDQPLSILTLSESSTIRLALTHLATSTEYSLDLRILESRPLYEGVSLAGSLIEALDTSTSSSSDKKLKSHKITLYPDTSPALAATTEGGKAVDLVLIGSDRISASGSVLNKTGSLPTVLSARHVGGSDTRVVVLGETEKIALPGKEKDHDSEENDPTQITRAWSAEDNSQRVQSAAAVLEEKVKGESKAGSCHEVKVAVKNVFFEWVPHSLIDAYITEQGGWAVGDIKNRSEKLAAEETRLFGSL